MPVDLYVGGNEHAVLHLLYARFWHKVLYDAGFVSTKEPFQRLFHQGMIHKTSFRDARGKYHERDEVERAAEGQVDPATDNFARLSSATWYVHGTDDVVETKLDKMSKSRYNVVNPDDMCAEYGADAMRLYELFMGPLEDGVEWETIGRVGHAAVPRSRVAAARRSGDRHARPARSARTRPTDNRELERALHAAIKKVTQSVDRPAVQHRDRRDDGVRQRGDEGDRGAARRGSRRS